MGSREWCVATDLVIQWLEQLGEQLNNWLLKTIVPAHWAEWVQNWLVPDDWPTWVQMLAKSIKVVLASIVSLGASVTNTILDLIRCSWYYTLSVSQIKQPTAYFSVLVLSHIVKYVDGTRVGSQSYLGFTVGTHLSIPALTDWLRTTLHYLYPHEIPSLPEVREAWLKGYILDDQQVECLMKLNGANPKTWWTYFKAGQEQLTTPELIEYVRRKGGDAFQQATALRDLGWTTPAIADARVYLYDELPTISDHLLWLRKGIFIPGYVDRYGLDAGFTDFYSGQIKSDLHASGYTEYCAERDYEAHWIQPGPEQLREFVYRLRPGKDGVSKSFDVEDYKRLLVEQEYCAACP